MLQRNVGEVEVHILQEQVGGYEYVLVTVVVEYGAVIAHAECCALVYGRNSLGEPVDKTELTEARYFCLIFVHASFVG